MKHCRFCSSTLSVSRGARANVYCDAVCASKHTMKKIVDKWLAGEIVGYVGKTKQIRKSIKVYLRNTLGTACSKCGWDERHPVDGAVLTEIDHIDGDAENCSPNNLRILCPNCHSMTPTFRARNKESKRIRN